MSLRGPDRRLRVVKGVKRSGAWPPAHDGVRRAGDRFFVGSDGKEAESLIKARISMIKCFEITVDVCLIGFAQGRLKKARADSLALRRRRNADDRQVP